MSNDNSRSAGVFQKLKTEILEGERKKARRLSIRYVSVIFVLFSALLVGLYAYATKQAEVESRQWATLEADEKEQLRIEAYAKFPEILAHNKRGKYYNVQNWMIEEKGLTHPFVRDIFRVDIGKITIWNGKEYNLPGVYTTLLDDAPKVAAYINDPNTQPDNLKRWLLQVRGQADYVTEDGVSVYRMIESRFKDLN